MRHVDKRRKIHKVRAPPDLQWRLHEAEREAGGVRKEMDAAVGAETDAITALAESTRRMRRNQTDETLELGNRVLPLGAVQYTRDKEKLMHRRNLREVERAGAACDETRKRLLVATRALRETKREVEVAWRGNRLPLSADAWQWVSTVLLLSAEFAAEKMLAMVCKKTLEAARTARASRPVLTLQTDPALFASASHSVSGMYVLPRIKREALMGCVWVCDWFACNRDESGTMQALRLCVVMPSKRTIYKVCAVDHTQERVLLTRDPVDDDDDAWKYDVSACGGVLVGVNRADMPIVRSIPMRLVCDQSVPFDAAAVTSYWHVSRCIDGMSVRRVDGEWGLYQRSKGALDCEHRVRLGIDRTGPVPVIRLKFDVIAK